MLSGLELDALKLVPINNNGKINVRLQVRGSFTFHIYKNTSLENVISKSIKKNVVLQINRTGD